MISLNQVKFARRIEIQRLKVLGRLTVNGVPSVLFIIFLYTGEGEMPIAKTRIVHVSWLTVLALIGD